MLNGIIVNIFKIMGTIELTAHKRVSLSSTLMAFLSLSLLSLSFTKTLSRISLSLSLFTQIVRSLSLTWFSLLLRFVSHSALYLSTFLGAPSVVLAISPSLISLSLSLFVNSSCDIVHFFFPVEMPLIPFFFFVFLSWVDNPWVDLISFSFFLPK